MPQWSNDPPTEDPEYAHRIIRTPGTKPICGIITSPDLIGCLTHFVNNRTIPCEAPNACGPCDSGSSRRWHGYVSLLNNATMEHAIFEMTAAACDPLKNYGLAHQTLRACSIRASRPSGKSNGRVIIETRHIDESRYRLPEPFNVRMVLCHIWNIDYTPTEEFVGRAPTFKSIGIPPAGGDGRYRQDAAG